MLTQDGLAECAQPGKNPLKYSAILIIIIITIIINEIILCSISKFNYILVYSPVSVEAPSK